jgi:hypothetical protein
MKATRKRTAVKPAKPVKAWASVWVENGEDAICQIGFWRDTLQSNLRKIRVLVSPLVAPPRRGRGKK